MSVSSTTVRRPIHAPRSRVVAALLDPAANEVGWRESLARLAALVETLRQTPPSTVGTWPACKGSGRRTRPVPA